MGRQLNGGFRRWDSGSGHSDRHQSTAANDPIQVILRCTRDLRLPPELATPVPLSGRQQRVTTAALRSLSLFESQHSLRQRVEGRIYLELWPRLIEDAREMTERLGS